MSLPSRSSPQASEGWCGREDLNLHPFQGAFDPLLIASCTSRAPISAALTVCVALCGWHRLDGGTAGLTSHFDPANQPYELIAMILQTAKSLIDARQAFAVSIRPLGRGRPRSRRGVSR